MYFPGFFLAQIEAKVVPSWPWQYREYVVVQLVCFRYFLKCSFFFYARHFAIFFGKFTYVDGLDWNSPCTACNRPSQSCDVKIKHNIWMTFILKVVLFILFFFKKFYMHLCERHKQENDLCLRSYQQSVCNIVISCTMAGRKRFAQIMISQSPVVIYMIRGFVFRMSTHLKNVENSHAHCRYF